MFSLPLGDDSQLKGNLTESQESKPSLVSVLEPPCPSPMTTKYDNVAAHFTTSSSFGHSALNPKSANRATNCPALDGIKRKLRTIEGKSVPTVKKSMGLSNFFS